VVLGLCGLAVVAVVAWKSWRIGLEHWYIAKLDLEDRTLREDAVARLTGMASVRAVPYLIEAIARRAGEEEEIDSAAWPERCCHAIAAAGVGALPGLEGKLRSESPVERLWAAGLIGRLGLDAAGAVGDLFPLLSDEDPRVRS
jgi:hypothetical protein